MSSPLTGLQQFANVTFISSIPLTMISFFMFTETLLFITLSNIISSLVFTSLFKMLITTDGVYFPFPIHRYISSILISFNVFNNNSTFFLF